MKIKKNLLIISIILSCVNILSAQQYTYKVDLRNVLKDRVKVTCMVPKQSAGKVDFIFPNVIPGSYALKEYGRYIKDFVAYGENGEKLKVQKADKYNFTIENAEQLQRVEYFVNDSWEEKKSKQFIFQPGGTNINAGENFVINNYGFFGYIDGNKNLPFEITFSKPSNLKGYSYLDINALNDSTDLLNVVGYDLLADNPIMYCQPKEASFKVGNTEINICVYSESNKVSATQAAEIVKPLAKALENFFGTLPVDSYTFMFYLADPNNVPKRKGKGLGSGFGALEHNHCSFYFMPENSNFKILEEDLKQVCAHEFLHILTPLNIHSKEIEDFNFRVPVMSKHLWMYEGVTEYFSQLVLLQDSLQTMDEFIKEMRSKIYRSSTFDKFSMTDMSKNVITSENQARYLSVYSRGAILAMMMDILIIDKSDGKSSLKQVMMELAKKYGPSKPFNDDDLIVEIESLTNPEVGAFLKASIVGSTEPDYKYFFNLIGYDYYSMFKKNTYYFGRFGLSYDDNKNQLYFSNVEINGLGVQEKDVLVSINNESVDMGNIDRLYESYFSDNDDGKDVSIEIIRNGNKMRLTASPQKAVKQMSNYIAPISNPDLKATNNMNKFNGTVN